MEFAECMRDNDVRELPDPDRLGGTAGVLFVKDIRSDPRQARAGGPGGTDTRQR